MGPPTRLRLEFLRETGPILSCDGKVGIPFQTKQGNQPSCQDQEGRRGSEEVVPGISVFLWSETGMSGNFLGCITGVLYRVEPQDRTWYFSCASVVGKGFTLR